MVRKRTKWGQLGHLTLPDEKPHKRLKHEIASQMPQLNHTRNSLKKVNGTGKRQSSGTSFNGAIKEAKGVNRTLRNRSWSWCKRRGE